MPPYVKRLIKSVDVRYHLLSIKRFRTKKIIGFVFRVVESYFYLDYEGEIRISSAWELSSDKMIVNIKKAVLRGQKKTLDETWLEA
jgi:hypothetical protein